MSEARPSRGRSILALALAVGWAPPAARAQTAGAPEPLGLRQAVELAAAHAPEVAVALAAGAEASASARLARDSFHPEAWVSAGPGYAHGLPGGASGRLPSIAGVEVRQAVYDAARSADAQQAEAQSALARAGAETTRAASGQSVVVVYGRCWADEALVRNAVERQEAAAAARARTEALRHEGRASAADLEHAWLLEAQARQARLDRESDRDLDQLELRRLVGWDRGGPLVLADDPLAVLADVGPGDGLVAARAADPERQGLAEASRHLDRAGALRRRSWSPVVEADAQYSRLVHYPGYDDFYRTFRADNWSVGLSVTVPLWTGGRAGDAAARLAASRGRVAAQLVARDAVLELAVRRAEASAAGAVARASLARRAEGVAEGDVRAARALAAEGRIGLDELGRREISLADARDDAVRAENDLLAARAQALRLRGGLLEALGQRHDAQARESFE